LDAGRHRVTVASDLLPRTCRLRGVGSSSHVRAARWAVSDER